jgi:hypothetical protein
MNINLNMDKEQLAMLSGALGVFKDAVDAAIAAEAEPSETPEMNSGDPMSGMAEELSKMRG